jgi:dTDP-4-amino-4,6-dideoxygalactose transaminase
LPRTEAFVKQLLSLPMFPGLAEAQAIAVADAIKAHLQ